MLVLNTTSPRASPSAPAAAPRNSVPSSSARIASIVLRTLPLHVARARARSQRRHCLTRACVQRSLQRLASIVSNDAVIRFCFARDDADRRRPAAVALVLEADRVRAGRHRRQRQRRRAHELAVQEHRGAGRPRDDRQGAGEAARGRARRAAGGVGAVARARGAAAPAARARSSATATAATAVITTRRSSAT